MGGSWMGRQLSMAMCSATLRRMAKIFSMYTLFPFYDTFGGIWGRAREGDGWMLNCEFNDMSSNVPSKQK